MTIKRRSLFALLLAPLVPAANAVSSIVEPVKRRWDAVFRQKEFIDLSEAPATDLLEEKYSHIMRQVMEEEDRRWVEELSKGRIKKPTN